MASSIHVPVLLHEVLHGLSVRRGETVLDGTTGGGGHTSELAREVGDRGRVIALDLDEDALAASASKVEAAGCKNVTFIKSNFRHAVTVLPEAGIPIVNKVLLDLGLRSDQLDTTKRGFSFQKDEPLLMTFSALPGKEELTARDIVNHFSEADLANVIYAYGEERYARRFAKMIVEARTLAPIETSGHLADVISAAAPSSYRRGKIHPATRVFQALRIATNDELGALKDGLQGAWTLLSPHGRIAVISFHSLEDRIVKHFFQERSKAAEGTIITKKPITPSHEEMSENPRSRSAKLRIMEKS